VSRWSYLAEFFQLILASLENSHTPKSDGNVKRWLTLTNNVLSDNCRDELVEARTESLDLLLANMKTHLEAATTLQFTESIRRRLSGAISPQLTTLRMLHFQEWEFKLSMVEASRKGRAVSFRPATMDAMFWAEAGFVQASLFPQLSRLEGCGEGDVRSSACRGRECC
jgi:hypothetical protein